MSAGAPADRFPSCSSLISFAGFPVDRTTTSLSGIPSARNLLMMFVMSFMPILERLVTAASPEQGRVAGEVRPGQQVHVQHGFLRCGSDRCGVVLRRAPLSARKRSPTWNVRTTYRTMSAPVDRKSVV